MPPSPAKEARMACSPADEASFIKQQKTLRDQCSSILACHLKLGPDVVWTPEDSFGRYPTTKQEEAQLKLVLDVEYNEKTSEWEFPPANNRLSDELVYLAVKFMTARDRARQYSYDFDAMGHIKPERVSSGPAPIIWAHGLPFFPVYKGYYILCGRAHADCIGWLLHEKNKEIMQANPILSVGAVIAPDSAVMIPHTITRQMTQHQPRGSENESKYRCKAWNRDVVAAEHHLCAVLPNLGTDEIEVCRLWRALGYNVCCGPVKRGVKPTTIPKEFFTSQGIKDVDYKYLARPYGNHLLDEDDELDEETDSDDDMEVEELAGKSGEVASSSNQPTTTQPVPQLDVNMEIDSPVEVPAQVPAQGPVQVAEEIQKEAIEKVMEEVKKEAKKEVSKDPEITPPGLEEKQPATSSSVVNAELDVDMNIDDPIEESTDKSKEQTSTTTIPFAETAIQAATTAEPSDVELMTEDSEIGQAVTNTSAGNIQTVDLLEVEQIAPGQPCTG
ncbi:hypothetical protein PEX1_018670 [Penicillium expansum]|uniref:Uncharacterized protein n=1 Tax=Penicillium expansum TaxID=27334 RepID=A0A0A2IFW4_PENEN|nr:hypothetical protein PEX2_055960 [Penicillium expansum]KGO41343.1 hypothetical protein PEXP_107230 [Penicillium expansum]KGO50118.1 hypothetical protein PEX2_055960 [Penicillium expansum]KGO60874.1 hypothetical protein PEX1_018670 [Penicillium expansum]